MLASPDQQDPRLPIPIPRSMATSGRGSKGSSDTTMQVAVDTEHHLIVTHEGDQRWLRPRAARAPLPKATKATLQTADQVGGRGRRGTSAGRRSWHASRPASTVTLPKPDDIPGAKSDGRFGANRTSSICRRRMLYRCPAGERLRYYFTNVENGLARCVATGRTRACTCELKSRCTTGGATPDPHGGSTSTWSKPCEKARRRSSGHAPAAWRPSSIPSARSRPGWEQPTSYDEDTTTRGHRDGAARPRLQPHPCHEHHGTGPADRGNADIALGSETVTAMPMP